MTRMKSLNDKRDAVQTRVEQVLWECVDPKIINAKVEKILASMQSYQPCDVVKGIHKLLSDYNDMIWSWYAVWNYKPESQNTIGTKFFEPSPNAQSMAENGGWKVYWTAQLKPDDWDKQGSLKVNSAIFYPALDLNYLNNCVASLIMFNSALYRSQSGRKANNLLVLCNPPQYSCGFGTDVYFEQFKGRAKTIDILMN